MKVRFYPEKELWREHPDFDFSLRDQQVITLQTRAIFDYKEFHDRQELIEYLTNNGICLTDPDNPLTFRITDINTTEHNWGSLTYEIVQISTIGWMKELG